MKGRRIKETHILAIAVFVLLEILAAWLIGTDTWTFNAWWLAAFVLGLLAMPVTGRLFENFKDKGWLFSKVLAITATGFLTWFLVTVDILKFSSGTCVGICVLGGVFCIYLYQKDQKLGKTYFPYEEISLIIWEELLFFAIFLLWTYLAGFHPEAYGTEKFMDYGFMEAMMRSSTLPAIDLWYSEGTINYYYGGQYFAVFLTKLTGTKVELTYNLMRTFVAAFAFVLPFSLVYQMITDRIAKNPAKKSSIPIFAGITAGVAVSIAGNMHYVIYGKILPWIQKIRGEEVTEGYWFPDATRYIGYDPDVPDKTIHEFPSYSFILGDLHAHVVNIMFVLLMVGILYAWTQKIRLKKIDWNQMSKKKFWEEQLLMPHIILGSVLLGMFQWSNFWDFVIYFVVMGGVVLFGNIIQFNGKIKEILTVTLVQAIEVLVVSYVVILPFTLKFKTMVQGVALAQNHSMIHQLLILWGLPSILTLLFIGIVIYEQISGKKVSNLYEFMRETTIPDLFAVITGLCALGLIMIPEIVYVRDIYENGHARANTMFKLTYQAYILFGITMGYVIYRAFLVMKSKIVKGLYIIGLILLAWTVGYFGKAVDSWFGNVLNPANYKGLDALTFIERDFPEDAAAIRWLKENINGNPVVLEANGDSYTGFERVSATTGLPTVLGWYVHEWLWRNDVGDLNAKAADIEGIYTSTDMDSVKSILAKYNVSYVFIGSKEKEKYGENLNAEGLKSIGAVIFQDENYDTCIVKVS